MIRVFIGYDRRIPVAFHALVHSITSRSSLPVSVCPINLTNLGGIYTREVNPLQSTEFSFSRFLAPWLCGYEGWSIFMDNDMIVLDDIAKLWALRDDRYAVMCVKHSHKPSEHTKFMGAPQTSYEKKNWSSVMLFNNSKCRALTPEYVNTATGLELHQFKWLDDERSIGELPREWNYLVDYDEPLPGMAVPSLLHYTIGGPFYPDYAECSYAKEWFRSFVDANNCKEADIYRLAALAQQTMNGKEAEIYALTGVRKQKAS